MDEKELEGKEEQAVPEKTDPVDEQGDVKPETDAQVVFTPIFELNDDEYLDGQSDAELIYEDTDITSLALDSEGDFNFYDSINDAEEYESFLSEYRSFMSERLASVSSINEESADKHSEMFECDTVEDKTDEPITGQSEKDVDESAEDEIVAEEIPEIESAVNETEEADVKNEIIDLGDIEFHNDIVEKSARTNAENYIRLVPEKEEEQQPPEEETSAEDSTDAPADEAECSPATEEEMPEQIPEQLEMELDEPKVPKKRNRTVYDENNPRIVDHIFDAVEMIAMTLLAAIVITSLFFRFSFVDGHSMDKTLNDRDTLLISDLFYTPDYGDIVVVDYVARDGKQKPLIKRVIGLPGDTIEIDRHGQVYRNGELLDESAYVYLDGPIPESLDGKWQLGEDEIFIMGDHRNNSNDSRSSAIGPVKVDKIIGRVLMRILPFTSFGTID